MSSNSLQDTFNFLFALLIFVPVNLIALTLAWGAMALLNRLLKLRFRAVTIALAAGALVMAFDFYWLDEVNTHRGWVSFASTPLMLYAFTGILTLLNAGIVGVFSLILKGRAGRNPPPLPEDPSPSKARRWAVLGWLGLTLVLGAMPLLRAGREAYGEQRGAAEMVELEGIIRRGDVAAFRKKAEDQPEFWNVKLTDQSKSLFDELMSRDQVEMAAFLLDRDRRLLEYSFDWDVRSPAMADALIAVGLPADRLIMELVEGNRADVVRHVVEKHHPPFAKWVDLTCMILLREKNDVLLEYLASRGMTGNKEAGAEATALCAEKNDFAGLKRLVELGFAINPQDVRPPYWAVYHHNLPMLKWLMPRGFDVNGKVSGYTHLENAIAGGQREAFDYLLTLNPDVETRHPTQLNGDTNALLMAQRYEHPGMLERLRQYVARRKLEFLVE